jgi:hypothetical protein
MGWQRAGFETDEGFVSGGQLDSQVGQRQFAVRFTGMKHLILLVLAAISAAMSAAAQAEEALQPPDPGEIARQTALLHEVADLWAANLDKIETWQGKAAITRVSVNRDGDGKRHEQSASAEFILDRTSDQLLWTRTEGETVVSLEDKSWREPSVSEFASGLLTATTLTRFPLSPLKENRAKKQPAHALSRPREEERLSYYHDFDPVWYLSYGGEHAAKRMRFLATILGRAGSNWHVVKFGETVIVEFDNGDLINRYTFRLDWGGMPASYEGISAEGSDVVKWKFERQREVWLPTEWTELSNKLPAARDGEPQAPKVRSLEVKFVRNQVNEKLAVDAFDLRHLGLEQGDLICDRPTNEYREFRPAPKSNALFPAAE